MPTELLTIGPVHVILVNTVYALPARACILFCELPASLFEQSNHVSFANPAPVDIATDGMANVSGAFLRCTNANTLITLKAA